MSREDELADLLERWDAMKAGGSDISPAEHCRDVPLLLPDFEKLLRDLGPIHAIFSDSASSQSADGRLPATSTGRYVAKAFHAKGGLGAVYVADDEELHRQVALKRMHVIQALDAAARRQFLSEAQITGKLEHPGIVPVYGVGVDADGSPYYAMRFIHGHTLKDAVDGLHSRNDRSTADWNVEFRRLLRAFVTTCQSVAYAHSRGVIHRDLKPANVMLGPFGETLVVDWGLAKVLEKDQRSPAPPGLSPIRIESGPGMETLAGSETIDGEFKGSPAFMSPEQARGEWDKVGPAADVYSLGATLYYVLTGTKSIDGANVAQVIESAQCGQFVSPRKRNRGVPVALDAVCRKAMAAIPQDRYESASSLADDIERWLADEPIRAWREPWTTRARRWAKRHRTLVASALAVLMSTTVLLAATGAILCGRNRTLRRLNGELTESYAQSTAEFEAADVTLRSVVESLFVRTPTGAAVLNDLVRLDVIQKYEAHLLGFIDRNQDKAYLRREVGVSLLKLGEVEGLLGRKEKALATFERAAAIFFRLSEVDAEDRDIQFGLACAVSDQGLVLAELGQFAKARPLVLQGRRMFESLARDQSPIRLARFTSDSTGDVYRDSPALRLSKLTVVLLTELREAGKLANLNSIVPTATGLSKEEKTWAESALQALRGGHDIPMDAPVFTQYFAMSIESSLAADMPIAQKRKVFQAVQVRTDALMKAYPIFHELRLLKMEAAKGLADCAESDADLKAADSHLLDSLFAANELIEKVKDHDPFMVRGSVLVARAELWEKLADLAVLRKNEALVHGYVGACVRSIDDYFALKRHSASDTVRLLMLCVKLAVRASFLPASREAAESMYTIGGDLAAMQLKESPNEPALEHCQLACNVAAAGIRAARKKPIGDMLTSAERTLAKLWAETPGDPFLRIQKALMLSARATESALVNNNDRAAIVLIDDALREIAAIEEASEAPADIGVLRLTVEIQKIALLGGLADRILDDKPQGDAEALRLAIAAIKLFDENSQRPEPEVSVPELKRVWSYLSARRNSLLPEMEKLKSRAEGKK